MAAPYTTFVHSTVASVLGTAKNLAFLGTVFGIEKLAHGFGVDEHSAAGLGVSVAQFLALSAHSIHSSVEGSRIHAHEEAEASERERLFNHDLAKAVARSIRTILTSPSILEDDKLPLKERKALRLAAERAEDAWLEIVKKHVDGSSDDRFAPLLEAKVRDAITLNPADPAFPDWGDVELWTAVVREMADAAGERVSKALPDNCATFLRAIAASRAEFSRQFYNDIKHDLAGPRGGAAFAAVHLRMLGEVVVRIRTMSSTQEEMARKQDQILEAVETQGSLVLASAASRPDFNVVVKYAAWLRKLDRRLDGIDRRLAGLGGSVKDVHKAVGRVQQAAETGFRSGERHTSKEHGRTRKTTSLLISTSALFIAAIVVLGFVWSHLRTRVEEKRQKEAALKLLSNEIRENVETADRRIGLLTVLAKADLWPPDVAGDALRNQREFLRQNAYKREAFAAARALPAVVAEPAWKDIESFYAEIDPNGVADRTPNETMKSLEDLLVKVPAPPQSLLCDAMRLWALSLEQHCHRVGMLAEEALAATCDLQPLREYRNLPLAAETAGESAPSVQIANHCAGAGRGILAEVICGDLQQKFNALMRSDRDKLPGLAAQARAAGCAPLTRIAYDRMIEWSGDDPVTVSYAKMGLDQLDRPQVYGNLRGAFITGYAEDSPGRRAGLLIGDLIVRHGEYSVDTIDDLIRAITKSEGDAVATVVIRNQVQVIVKCPSGRLGIETVGY